MTRRKFALGALFAGASGIALGGTSTNVDYLGSNKLEKVVPKQIGAGTSSAPTGWSSRRRISSPGPLSQLMTRVYDDGQTPPIMLLVAQSASRRHSPDPPAGILLLRGGYALSPSQMPMVQLPQALSCAVDR